MHWSRNWIAALAIGLATAGMAIDAQARASNTKDTAVRSGTIEFAIDREDYIAQARAALQGDPVIAARIGAIRQLALDDAASMQQPGADVLVFDLQGSRGNGRVTARFITVDEHREALGPGTLVLTDGQRHPVGDAAAVEADVEAAEPSLLALGAGLFVEQARAAVQRYPDTERHLGRIERFDLDTEATFAAEGFETFVFDVVGSRASGRISADFITVDADTERLGAGTLTLTNGRTIRFDGEPRSEAELEAYDAPMIPADAPFILQARDAVQRYDVTASHLGRISTFTLDERATMKAAGMLSFVFDVVGSEGRGRIEAEFITVDAERERLGAGTLTLADGRRIAFDGEPPVPGEGESVQSDGFTIPNDSPFVLQARQAVERHAPLAGELGRIERFDIDGPASLEADGLQFVFDVAGSRASGRLEAEFITVDADTERLGAGTLTLASGRVIRFDGEAPFPQESGRDAMPDSFAPQDGIFVQQSLAALREHPLVRRHLGEVRDARIDRQASWDMPGQQYAFDLVGSKGHARLEAEFVTVDADTEAMGEGVLILANGRRIGLEAR